MIIGVDFNVSHATLASVRFCFPRRVEQLNVPKFLQSNTAPDSAAGIGLRCAPALTSVLVAECPVLVRFVRAEHMRAEQSLHAIVDSRNRPPMNHRRLDKAVNLFQRSSCSSIRRAHSLPEYSRSAKCLNLFRL
jgi:hypothetical protein